MKKVILFCLTMVILFTVSAMAQSIDTSSYLLMHLFSAAEDAGGQGSALGKIVSVLPGEGSSNPALMNVEKKAVLLKYGVYNINDNDKTDIVTLQFRYIARLSKDQVIALNYYGADTGRMSTKMLPFPAIKRFQENDISVAYRKDINKNWSFGVAGALLPVRMNVRLDNGTNIASLKSNVCYGLEPAFGYQSSDGKWVAGLVSQLYMERSDLVLMGKSFSDRYKTINNFLGIGFKPTKKDLIVAEIEKGRVTSGIRTIPIETFKIGFEHSAGSFAFRIGLMDDKPTYGIGFKNGSVRADLSYLDGPHNDQLGSMGGAKTLLLSLISNF